MKYIILITLLILSCFTVFAQDSFNGIHISNVNNLKGSNVKALKIFEINEVEGTKKMVSVFRYDRDGRITQYEAKDLKKYYKYDSCGNSVATFYNEGDLNEQKIEIHYKDIKLSLINTRVLDTLEGLFIRAITQFKNIIDTIKVNSKNEKVSRVLWANYKNEYHNIKITKSYLTNGKIYKEVSTGFSPEVVEWKYDGKGVLTKVYYNKEGHKHRVIRYGKSMELIEEEFHGGAFDQYGTIAEYTGTLRLKTFKSTKGGYPFRIFEYFYDNTTGLLWEVHKSNDLDNSKHIEIYEYEYWDR